MPSDFEGAFDNAMDVLKGRLGVTAIYTKPETGVVITDATVIFNEQVGFVDARRRAVFTFDRDDIGSATRGDYFVIDGETDRWTVVDVRDDRAGGIEVRCDGTLERL